MPQPSDGPSGLTPLRGSYEVVRLDWLARRTLANEGREERREALRRALPRKRRNSRRRPQE